MNEDASITHVADTALWVAAVRARETRRRHAAFRDAFAADLAGERGRRIARSIPGSAVVDWGMIIRTTAIDRMIAAATASGVDTVLNLGAGLDTRPYRMHLPAQLRWIELDFPDLIALKESRLAAHEPICRLERVGVDLLNLRARRETLARYGAASQGMLIVTEGVIPYLTGEDVALLARDLHAVAPIRGWIQDFDNAGKRGVPRRWREKLESAPFLFQVDNWFEFFRQSGWRADQIITGAEESARINRPYPWNFPAGLIMHALPKKMQKQILDMSGAVLMHKI